MKPNNEKKEDLANKLSEIFTLYADAAIMTLLNDTVAIGTWPTPESPDVKAGNGRVAINTVPLPERPRKLKTLISELIEIGGKDTLGVLLR